MRNALRVLAVTLVVIAAAEVGLTIFLNEFHDSPSNASSILSGPEVSPNGVGAYEQIYHCDPTCATSKKKATY